MTMRDRRGLTAMRRSYAGALPRPNHRVSWRRASSDSHGVRVVPMARRLSVCRAKNLPSGLVFLKPRPLKLAAVRDIGIGYQ